jgi:hypothetical protein
LKIAKILEADDGRVRRHYGQTFCLIDIVETAAGSGLRSPVCEETRRPMNNGLGNKKGKSHSPSGCGDLVARFQCYCMLETSKGAQHSRLVSVFRQAG